MKKNWKILQPVCSFVSFSPHSLTSPPPPLYQSDMDADDEGSLEADYLAILAQLRVDDNSE